MQSWLRVGSLVKLFFGEVVAMLCLSGVATYAVGRLGRYGCPPSANPLGAAEIFFGFLGVILFAWIVYRILVPQLLQDTFRPILKISWLIIYNPLIPGVRYTFPSTHPSYILIDSIAVLMAGFFWNLFSRYSPSLAGCGTVAEYTFPWIALGIALFFPFLRLFSWYILRRRLPADAPLGKPASRPVVMFWGIVMVAVLPVALAIAVQERRAGKNLPVIEAANFSGGLAAHRDLDNAYVRVRGTLKAPGAVRCGCTVDDENCVWKTAAVLDLQAGGEVLAVAIYDGPELVSRTQSKIGQTVELYGQLQAMPSAEEKPWKLSACGSDQFGPAPATGRAYLEYGVSP